MGGVGRMDPITLIVAALAVGRPDAGVRVRWRGGRGPRLGA
jgi:hypothetical protein